MYKTESQFSRSLVTKLRARRCIVTRLESGSTQQGIPDMFVQFPDGRDVWLELKNIKKPLKDRLRIPFRPGQQAWMYSYYVYHQVKSCYTVIALSDVYILLPMRKIYTDNIVTSTEIEDCVYKSFDSLLNAIMEV